MTKVATSVPETNSLETLVSEIVGYENAIADWTEEQQQVVTGLKQSIEALHKEALSRMIRSLKQDAMSALRHAVEDELVYGLLRYHELIKPPQPSLEIRLQQALAEIRPGLKSHGGDVELVAIQPPDTVEVKLMGNCSNCPASTLTMKQGVEETVKRHCPEIDRVISV